MLRNKFLYSSIIIGALFSGCATNDKIVVKKYELKNSFIKDSKEFYYKNKLTFKTEYMGTNFSPLWFIGPNFLLTEEEYKVYNYSSKPLLLTGFGFKDYLNQNKFKNIKTSNFNSFKDLYVYMLNKMNNKQSYDVFMKNLEELIDINNFWEEHEKEKYIFIKNMFSSYKELSKMNLEEGLNQWYFLSENNEKIYLSYSEIEHYTFILTLSKFIVNKGLENEI